MNDRRKPVILRTTACSPHVYPVFSGSFIYLCAQVGKTCPAAGGGKRQKQTKTPWGRRHRQSLRGESAHHKAGRSRPPTVRGPSGQEHGVSSGVTHCSQRLQWPRSASFWQRSGARLGRQQAKRSSSSGPPGQPWVSQARLVEDRAPARHAGDSRESLPSTPDLRLCRVTLRTIAAKASCDPSHVADEPASTADVFAYGSPRGPELAPQAARPRVRPSVAGCAPGPSETVEWLRPCSVAQLPDPSPAEARGRNAIAPQTRGRTWSPSPSCRVLRRQQVYTTTAQIKSLAK